MRPAMTEKEINVFKKFIGESQHYLESGCGGTTLLTLDANVKQIDVVETDIDWIAKLRAEPRIEAALRSGKLRFHHRDVGKVIQWGIPKDETKKVNWPFYSLGVWNEIKRDVDFIFVDGRFRVATTLAALCMAKPTATIMLHDYKERPHYDAVLEYAEPVDRVDTALILRRKPEFSESEAMLRWSQFMFDAR